MACSATAALLGAVGCRRTPATADRAAIVITHVPEAAAGGPQDMDFIAGKVSGNVPGQRIVIYARSVVWWIQPLSLHYFTRIQSDGTWKNTTHLGTEYAALLVNPGYRPSARLANIPPVGGGIAAVTILKGRQGNPVISKTIRFSGYDWQVRAAGSDRGGAPRFYSPSNAWVDAQGHLHLRMELRDGQWYCSEVNMTRSLGYGTYRFTVEDVTHLGPSAVVGMFTYDEASLDNSRHELDVELSRWGDPSHNNAQYVVQPFFVPENVYRFGVPAGRLTYVIRWEPGSASFTTLRGGRIISEHAFTAGIPEAEGQTTHIDLYDFHYSRNLKHQPGEVVIDKFEYLP